MSADGCSEVHDVRDHELGRGRDRGEHALGVAEQRGEDQEDAGEGTRSLRTLRQVAPVADKTKLPSKRDLQRANSATVTSPSVGWASLLGHARGPPGAHARADNTLSTTEMPQSTRNTTKTP